MGQSGARSGAAGAATAAACRSNACSSWRRKGSWSASACSWPSAAAAAARRRLMAAVIASPLEGQSAGSLDPNRSKTRSRSAGLESGASSPESTAEIWAHGSSNGRG
eukprot:2419588-Pleurochrysis_carterae.AAC.1